jgi:hypothetical protein
MLDISFLSSQAVEIQTASAVDNLLPNAAEIKITLLAGDTNW